MTQALDWTQRTTEIPEGGLNTSRTASSGERKAIAAALDLLSCDDMQTTYSVRALGKGRYRLSGHIDANLTQACVITLEPVPKKLTAKFDVEFWPAAEVPEVDDSEMEALSAREIEPLGHSAIDVGRIVFETLSAAIDPYPRKAGAEFDWNDPGAGDEAAPAGPFDALRKLKPKQ